MTIDEKKLNRMRKLLNRWDGANYSVRGTCDFCGKRRQIGHIYKLDPNAENIKGHDYAGLCTKCWENMPKGWHQDGSGG